MPGSSELFMKEIHRIIIESADWAMAHLGSTPDKISPSIIPDRDKDALRAIGLRMNEEQALRGLIIEVGRAVAFGIFSTIDGVADREGLELPDLALINRLTGTNLADAFLHDEFYEHAPD